MKPTTAAALLGLGLALAPELAAQSHDRSNQDVRGQGEQPSRHGRVAGAPLGEAGNGAFAAVQEVVRLLESRPDTDWEKVDLEALRQHLIDMERMTLGVEVLSKEPVPGGVRTVVRGIDAAADVSLRRALAAHGTMIGQEQGWSMTVEPRDGAYEITVTSPRGEDAARIRGLGYIGLMALGNHHAPHHWMIASGSSPHAH